jgi:hypothetical protein
MLSTSGIGPSRLGAPLDLAVHELLSACRGGETILDDRSSGSVVSWSKNHRMPSWR